MLILLHIVLALSSIIWNGLAFFTPSARKLHISYGLIAGTLASGVYLTITTHSRLLNSCVTGIAYLAVVLFEIFAARSRLAKVIVRE